MADASNEPAEKTGVAQAFEADGGFADDGLEAPRPEGAAEADPDAQDEGRDFGREAADGADARPLFPHRPWMTGIVLVLALLAILGGTADPLWLWVGLPFILVLALHVYIRVRDWLRGKNSDIPE